MKIISLKLLLSLLILQLNCWKLISQVEKQPVNDTICYGNNASFGLIAIDSPEFQWRINIEDGWINLDEDLTYSGVNNDTLEINMPIMDFEDYQYCCILTYPDKSIEETFSSDTVQIIIDTIPGIAAKPTGKEEVCKGDTVDYSTIGTENATYYRWKINPENAGQIIGDDTLKNMTIVWSKLFAGNLATISVHGVNNCFEGEYSEELNVNLYQLPAVPDEPVGESDVCGGDTEVYETNPITGAISYLWKIIPDDGGETIGNDTLSSINIKWASAVEDVTAFLSVKSVNICGSSEFSEELEISIKKAPTEPDKPSGIETLCAGDQDIEYKTNIIANVTYAWHVDPENAGSISGSDSTGILDLSADFTGDAEIVVTVIGDCGETSSIPLNIYVNPIPSTPTIPTGPEEICSGTSTSYYETTITENAETYIWHLNPEDAGSISGTGLTAAVTWQESFTGFVNISVTGVNNECGSGNASPLIQVEVKKKVSPEITIGIEENPICKGDLAQFYVESILHPGTDTVYFWTVNDTIQGSDSSEFVSNNLKDKDIVKGYLISDVECSDFDTVASEQIIIQVSPAPEIRPLWIKTSPEIGRPVVLIVCCLDTTEIYNYQWLRNDEPILNANLQYYYKEGGIDDGIYVCRVQNTYNCNSFSEEYSYPINKGLIFHNDELFIVYPNPSNGQFKVELNSDNIPIGISSVTATLYSLTGEIVYSSSLTSSISELNFSKLNAGLYFLELKISKGQREIKKLVLQ